MNDELRELRCVGVLAGALVGVRLGSCDGLDAGLSDDADVGALVGGHDGVDVGLFDGAEVGALVGVHDGIGSGPLDGAPFGDKEGLDGMIVGLLDGTGVVGADDGAIEDACDGAAIGV